MRRGGASQGQAHAAHRGAGEGGSGDEKQPSKKRCVQGKGAVAGREEQTAKTKAPRKKTPQRGAGVCGGVCEACATSLRGGRGKGYQGSHQGEDANALHEPAEQALYVDAGNRTVTIALETEYIPSTSMQHFDEAARRRKVPLRLHTVLEYAFVVLVGYH